MFQTLVPVGLVDTVASGGSGTCGAKGCLAGGQPSILLKWTDGRFETAYDTTLTNWTHDRFIHTSHFLFYPRP